MTKEEIFNNNIGLAFEITKRCYQNVYLDIFDNDDLRQLALIGLWKASESYNPNKGVLFKTYADKCMKNEINRYVFNHKKTVYTMPIDTKIYDNRTIEDILADDNDYMNNIEDTMFCNSIISKIKSSRNQEILKKVIIEKEKACNIAEQFGISKQAVSSIIHRSLNLLGKELNR